MRHVCVVVLDTQVRINRKKVAADHPSLTELPTLRTALATLIERKASRRSKTRSVAYPQRRTSYPQTSSRLLTHLDQCDTVSALRLLRLA